MGLDAALLRYSDRQQLLDGSREPLDDDRAMREQAEGLDVEEEAGRGSFHPEVRVALRAQRIVGGIHVDNRKLACIVGEPVGSCLDAWWIGGAGVDQRPLGPAAGALVDVADRLAGLERQWLASGPRRHPVPPRCTAPGVAAGRVPAVTAALPFLRDDAASPMSDITTGGKHKATTLAAWASLSIFCM